jgi:site-specific DNA-methyltransferase (adenine-specific)/modification methylase
MSGIEPVILSNGQTTATLYCADCLEILPTLGKVDAVVTDPPYGVTSLSWDCKFRQEWLTAILGITEKAMVINAARPDIMAHCLSLQPIASRVVAWRQPKAKPLGGLFWTWQPIYCWGTFEGAWDTVEVACGAEKYEHPTQKPIALVQWMLRTTGGATACDPFMGSGTTGVACAKLGRNFIGIELDPDYFDIAVKRIKAALAQPSLFGEEIADASAR